MLSVANFGLFRQLLGRELRSRFVGSATGWVWLFLTPLLLLAVYGFIFGFIFQARVPVGLEMPFIAWLAVALWPWLAFSEGVLRGSQSIREHSALISKVALPRELLVLASVTAVFLLHLLGYALVLIVLAVFVGVQIHWLSLPGVLISLVTLYLFAVGLGLGLSALQIYLRDLEQFLPTFFMFWFFMTPILYPREMVPEAMAGWMGLNPMSGWMEQIRAGLLHGQHVPDLQAALYLLVLAVLVLLAGRFLFKRLSPYFEDFL
jgi:lipopolysaccharide transport system permease protein